MMVALHSAKQAILHLHSFILVYRLVIPSILDCTICDINNRTTLAASSAGERKQDPPVTRTVH